MTVVLEEGRKKFSPVLGMLGAMRAGELEGPSLHPSHVPRSPHHTCGIIMGKVDTVASDAQERWLWGVGHNV